MFSNYLALADYVKKNKIRSFDFKITELAGSWRHLTVPVERMSEELFTEGYGFDGSNYGYKTVEASDMVFIPDYSTAFIDPFWEEPTLSLMGEIYEMTAEGIKPFKNDTRAVLDRAINYLEESELADKIILGPEFEYYLFDRADFWNLPQSSGYSLDSKEAHWHVGEPEDNGGFRIRLKGGYHKDAPHDIYRDLRSEICSRLEEIGIAVKYHHHEVGAPGQHEIEVERSAAIKMADTTLLVKYFIKNLAISRGLTATFMPKPLYGEAGNGFHVHLQLFKDDIPIFHGPDENYAGLSTTALYFIGGILQHTPAIMGLAAPTTNSYKRLVTGYEAPVAICFAMANRSAVLRIPGYATDPADKRFEFRPGDASCNPYLTFAALLMAGMDGVENEIDPEEAGFGPVDENIYELVQNGRQELKFLPGSLEGALDALERDQQFLLKNGVFSEELLENWVANKRKESKAVNLYPTPGEFEYYFDV